MARVRETGEADGLSPPTIRGLFSGVFLPLSSLNARPRYRKQAKVSDRRIAQYRVADWKALYGPDAWWEDNVA